MLKDGIHFAFGKIELTMLIGYCTGIGLVCFKCHCFLRGIDSLEEGKTLGDACAE